MNIKQKRKSECSDLLEYIAQVMSEKDLRFAQLISNLQSFGINFDDEFYTENSDMRDKIHETLMIGFNIDKEPK